MNSSPSDSSFSKHGPSQHQHYGDEAQAHGGIHDNLQHCKLHLVVHEISSCGGATVLRHCKCPHPAVASSAPARAMVFFLHRFEVRPTRIIRQLFRISAAILDVVHSFSLCLRDVGQLGRVQDATVIERRGCQILCLQI